MGKLRVPECRGDFTEAEAPVLDADLAARVAANAAGVDGVAHLEFTASQTKDCP